MKIYPHAVSSPAPFACCSSPCMHRILCLPRALFSERESELSRLGNTPPFFPCLSLQVLHGKASTRSQGSPCGRRGRRRRAALSKRSAAGLLPASAALPVFGRRHATRVTKAVASSPQLALTGQAPPCVLIMARQHVSAVKRMWCNLCKEMIDLTDTGVTHCTVSLACLPITGQ
jgi:hypothetical protein